MRTTTRTVAAGLAAGVTALALALPTSAQQPRSERGQTLVVPGEHESMGTVYYVHPGKDAQATFTSDAPLEHIKGASNDVVGYGVWDAGSMRLLAGEFHLPVASLETGIPMRDEHLQGARWLDAETHPNVLFKLVDTRDARRSRSTDTFSVYDLTLVGDMTIKGVTKRMQIPAKVTLMTESERTRSRFPGDLLALRCTYDISLAEFGVSDPVIGEKVANNLQLETVLFMSTVSPDELRRR